MGITIAVASGSLAAEPELHAAFPFIGTANTFALGNEKQHGET